MTISARDEGPGAKSRVAAHARSDSATRVPDLAPTPPAPAATAAPAAPCDPVLTGSDLIEIHRLMCLTRALEERLLILYRQAKFLGGLYSATGGEAISVVSAFCLEHRDILCPLTRDIGARLAKGTAPETILRNYLGRVTGTMRARDGNLHQADLENNILAMISHLGAMISVVSGAVHAENLRGGNVVGMTYIGDGGASTGDFHEALNMAAVWKLALVLVLENNQYAYSTPTRAQYACENLADRAAGYGIPGVTVDGTDVPALYRALRQAVDRARAGQGPSLIECKILRMRGHGEHDDNKYIPRDLLEEWKHRDPIARLERLLIERGIRDEAAVASVRPEADRQIRDAVATVEREPFASPEDVLAGGGAVSPAGQE